jgi:hypothetical protein
VSFDQHQSNFLPSLLPSMGLLPLRLVPPRLSCVADSVNNIGHVFSATTTMCTAVHTTMSGA